MAMKSRYGINAQTVNFARGPQFVPVSYVEVEPGCSIQGSFQTNVHSAPTVRNIQTRAYLDGFAFYVPFRLLWEGFPSWLVDGTGTFPEVTDTMPQNFEPRLTDDSTRTGGAADRNTVWQRRAYNLIYNSFFASKDDEVASLDSAVTQTVWQRPSTFEMRSTISTSLPAQTIDTSGASITPDDVRSAFAQDQFNRLRNLYGARYTDYLAALGIEASWGILEDPEPRGKTHSDWKYRPVNITDSTNPGLATGYFNSSISIPLQKTFVPEHGLICAFACTRFDPMYDTPPCIPTLAKFERDLYWSPEYENDRVEEWSSTLINPDATVTYTLTRDKFDDYRVGINTNYADTFIGGEPQAIFVAEKKNKFAAADFDGNFQANVMPGNFTTQFTTSIRLTKNSPVRPAGMNAPLR